MGYYYKNNYENGLNVTNAEISQDSNTLDLYLCNSNIEPIEIVNNESIKFDFRKFIQVSNLGSILLETEREQLLYKEQESPLTSEQKDGEELDFFLLENNFFPVETCLYKIIIDFKDGSSVTLQRPIRGKDNSWMIVEHMFNFQNDIEKDTIDIHLYNLYGFETHLKLGFKVKQLSLQSQGIELSLVSANMDNEKRVSYIFNDLNENQLLLARRNAIK